MQPCKEDYLNLDNDNSDEFTCYGALVYTNRGPAGQRGTINFSFNTNEAVNYAGNDHDCICSLHRELDITTCKENLESSCVSDSDESNCRISWTGKIIDGLFSSSSCKKILVEGQCEFKCSTSKTGFLYEKTIKCTGTSDANNGNNIAGRCYNTPTSITQKSSITRDALSTTAPTTSTKSTTFVPFDKNHQTASQGNGDSVVIALGLVAGLAILALLVTLVLVFIFRRRKRGRKATCTKVYMDMNVSEVGSTTYESSMGSQKHHERLENECSNTKDRQSGLYMDLDDTAIVKSDQTTQQQQSGTEATDGIYNSIDEYEPNVDEDYAQTNDLSQRSQDLASPVDFPVPSADYFVLEKQEEMSSTRPTEDLNQTGNYFVLDKDEDRVLSDLTDNNTDSGIVNANKANTYFIVEEQRNEKNNESVPTDNNILLQKGTEISTKEGTPNDDTYNTLNSDINNEQDETTQEDYSHARGAGSSQQSTTRETTPAENVEDYDQLFQKPNNKVVYDADNDYDHINNDDPLTSL